MGGEVVIGTLGILLVVAIGAYLKRRQRRQDGALASLGLALGATRSTAQVLGVEDPGSQTLRGSHEGTAYECLYSEGGRRTPPFLRIRIPAPLAESFTLRRENRADRLFKKVGLSEEAQTGDRSFDEDVYIDGDATRHVGNLMRYAEHREVVRGIFRAGFTTIDHGGGHLTAIWSPFVLADGLEPSMVTDTVARLSVLAAGLTPSATAPSPASPRASRAAGVGWGSTLWFAGFGAACIAPWFLGRVWYTLVGAHELDVLVDSLRYSVPVAALLVALAAARVRGRASAHRHLGAAAGSALLLVLAGWSLVLLLNGLLDLAAERAHPAVVVDRYRYSNRSGGSRLVVYAQDATGQTYRLRVGEEDFGRAVPDRSRVTVYTKPGRFGYEWLAGYRFDR